MFLVLCSLKGMSFNISFNPWDMVIVLECQESSFVFHFFLLYLDIELYLVGLYEFYTVYSRI